MSGRKCTRFVFQKCLETILLLLLFEDQWPVGSKHLWFLSNLRRAELQLVWMMWRLCSWESQIRRVQLCLEPRIFSNHMLIQLSGSRSTSSCQIPANALRIIRWSENLRSRSHQSQKRLFWLDCQAVTLPPPFSQSTVKILRFDLPVEQIIGCQPPSENSCMTPEAKNKSRMMYCQPCEPRQPFTPQSLSFTGDDSAFWWRLFDTPADSPYPTHSRHLSDRSHLEEHKTHLFTLKYIKTQSEVII